MNCIQVLPRIITESSGPAYSVPRLCEALAAAGVETNLRLLRPTSLAAATSYRIDTESCPNLPGAFRLGWSPRFRRRLLEAAKEVDVIHGHGLWMMPNIYVADAARSSGARLVMSPRGTLSRWSLDRSRVKKAAVSALGQRRALFSADLLHATADKERDEIRGYGLSAPVAVIPNGIDVPGPIERRRAGPGRRLLYLSRIHPKKGLETLLDAWCGLQDRFPEWGLTVAGPMNSAYANAMPGAAADLGCRRVGFVGELTGKTKCAAFADSDLFVLPSHSENFGLVIAEALAHGLPVVACHGAPWAGLESHRCGGWVDSGRDRLMDALSAVMAASDAERRGMGERGREWMLREFDWRVVGEQFASAYAWLLGNGPKPEFIET